MAATGYYDSDLEEESLTDVEREEQEAVKELFASRARKRIPPPPSGSDEEQGAPNKKQTTGKTSSVPVQKTCTATKSAIPQKKPLATSQTTTTTVSLKPSLLALDPKGPTTYKGLLMATVPGKTFYLCHSIYLQYKHGDFSNKKRVRAFEKARETWKTLQGTIKQYAFGKLIEALKDIQKRYNVFTAN